jgi:hypothetical protein
VRNRKTLKKETVDEEVPTIKRKLASICPADLMVESPCLVVATKARSASKVHPRRFPTRHRSHPNSPRSRVGLA